MTDKRLVHVKVGVFYMTVSTGWSNAALIIEDNTGGVAQRKVTLTIDRPSDLTYIRERLDMIEASWRKQLDAIKVTPVNG